MTETRDLLHYDAAGLGQLVESLGQPAYRTRQIWRQLYQRGQIDPMAMSDLPSEFRQQLAAAAPAAGGCARSADFG